VQARSEERSATPRTEGPTAVEDELNFAKTLIACRACHLEAALGRLGA
jgi:hypothetical protein